MAEIIPIEQRRLMAKAGIEPPLNGQPLPEPSIDPGAAQRAQQAARDLAMANARKLQIMIAKIQKAVGRDANMNIFMGALVHLAGMTIARIPREKHANALQGFVNGVDHVVISTYPAELRAALEADYKEMERKRGVLNEQATEALAQALADSLAGNPQGEVSGVPATDQGDTGTEAAGDLRPVHDAPEGKQPS